VSPTDPATDTATASAPGRLRTFVGAFGSGLRGLCGRLCGVQGLKLLALAALLAVVLHLLGVLLLPFWPFTTRGSIYVDSPEVYTRERLVNDRYDQDYWLRQQLERLSAVTPEDLASGRLYSRAALSAGAQAEAAGGVPGQDAGDHGAGAMQQLSFRDRFAVLSGIRDMIRQQILENMLDDRHDLTANSIYGLKFDTTVVPGRNTRDRAFVAVTVEPEIVFEDIEASGPGLTDYMRTYVCRTRRPSDGADACEGVDAAQQAAYDKQTALYQAWLDDIEKRLNTNEASLVQSIGEEDEACPSPAPGVRAEQYPELIRRTLDVVLSLPEKRFLIDHQGRFLSQEAALEAGIADDSDAAADPDTDLDADPGTRTDAGADGAEVTAVEASGEDAVAPESGEDNGPPTAEGGSPKGGAIRLTEPWAKYMEIQVQPIRASDETACNVRVNFRVTAPRDFFIARRRSAATEPAEALPEASCARTQSLFPIGWTEDDTWQLLVDEWYFSQINDTRASFEPRYPIPDALLDALAETAADTAADARVFLTCPELVRADDVIVNPPSGLFNFIESMRELDAYTYAVFPKNDVLGVLRDTALAGAGGTGGAGFDLIRRLVQSGTESMAIGFGNGSTGKSDGERVGFGWVISAPAEMAPSLRSQLVLISVPAWTDKVQVQVTTGWLDGRGRRDAVQVHPPVEIRLPPDVTALDSIFRNQGWVSPAPRIKDEAMDKAIYVVAEQPASILIPGTRLWRSTAVTLGAQPADRIRVLPNMEGIIAEFRPVQLPFAKFNPRPTAEGEPEEAEACTLTEPADKGAAPRDIEEYKDLRVRPVRLRVWTSEGVAAATRPACVIYDPRAQITARVSGDRESVPDNGQTDGGGDATPEAPAPGDAAPGDEPDPQQE